MMAIPATVLVVAVTLLVWDLGRRWLAQRATEAGWRRHDDLGSRMAELDAKMSQRLAELEDWRRTEGLKKLGSRR